MPLSDIAAQLRAQLGEGDSTDPFAAARNKARTYKPSVAAPTGGLQKVREQIISSLGGESFIDGSVLPPGRPITREALRAAVIPEGSLPVDVLHQGLVDGLPVSPSGQERVVNDVAERLPGGSNAAANVVVPGVARTGASLVSLVQRLFDPAAADQTNREANLMMRGAERADEMAGRPSYWNRQARGAVSSLGMAATGGPMGVPGVIGLQAADSANQGYTDAIDAGLSPARATGHALTSGAIEGGITALFQRFAPGLEGAAAGQRIAGLVRNAASEYGEEVTIAVLNQVNQRLQGVDPQALTADTMLNVVGDTLAQTTLALGASQGLELSQRALEARQQRQQAMQGLFAPPAAAVAAPVPPAAPAAPLAPPAAAVPSEPAPPAPVFEGGPQGGGPVEQPGGITPEDAAATIASLFGQAQDQEATQGELDRWAGTYAGTSDDEALAREMGRRAPYSRGEAPPIAPGDPPPADPSPADEADAALAGLPAAAKRQRLKAEALAKRQAEQAQQAAARGPVAAAPAAAGFKPGDLVDITAGSKGLRRAEVLSVAADGRLAVRFADDGKTQRGVPGARAARVNDGSLPTAPATQQDSGQTQAPAAAPVPAPTPAPIENAAPASPSQLEHYRQFVADLSPEERAAVAADLAAVGDAPADPFSAMQGIRQSLVMAKAVEERKAKRAAKSKETVNAATPPPPANQPGVDAGSRRVQAAEADVLPPAEPVGGDTSRVQASERAAQPVPAAPVPPAEPAAGDGAVSAPSAAEGRTVGGWKPFPAKTGSLGIPRADMPQVKSEHRGALANFLRARGIEFERAEVKPGALKPTQAEFSPAKVAKAKKHTGEQRAILVSADNHIVDGHHQWMAAMGKPSEQIPVVRLQAPIREVLAALKEFPSSTQDQASQPPAADRVAAPPGEESEQSALIEDVGEKLGGARKDAPPLSLTRDFTSADLATKPLSEIWPASEIAEEQDVAKAALYQAMRDEIPAKPRKGYKVARWVEGVELIRGLAVKLSRGEITDLHQELRNTRSWALGRVSDKAKLLEQIDRSQWGRIGQVESHEGAYRYEKDGSKTPIPSVFVAIDGRSESIAPPPGEGTLLERAARVVAERVGTPKPEAKMQFEVRGPRNGPFGINKKGDRLYQKLKTFPTAKEALDYIRSNHADLVEAWNKASGKDKPPLARPLNPDAKRIGKDRRSQEISADDLRTTFGFRGVEFGNWTNQADRQQGINQAFDGLHDLAELMGVPPKALSLNGALGLAFGARGAGKYAAHYEPGRVVINLTRTKGAGALAHEWAHAVDNYFGKMGSPGDAAAFSSGEVSPKLIDAAGKAGIRPEIVEAWSAIRRAMMQKADGSRSNYAVESGAADARRDKKYWSTPHEMFARAFETWAAQRLEDAGASSPYLVQGVPTGTTDLTNATDWERRYPLNEDAQRINSAIDSWTKTLKSEETEGGTVRLFGPERIPGEGDTLAAQERTPGDEKSPRAPRPGPDQGIELAIEWAISDREQTIAQHRAKAERTRDPEMKAAYERIANDFADVDPDAMAAHMRAYPSHYLGAISGRGGNMHPVQIYRQRADLPPVEPRASIAPMPNEGVAPDLRKTLKSLAADLKKASSSAPVLDVDRGALPEGVAGEFDTRTQGITTRYHNDLDLVAHEVGHWTGETYNLLPAADDTAARAELARFGVHGTPAKGDLRLREGMAEYFRAWMVNPGEAERRGPVFTAQVREKVPARVLDALQAYGMAVRRFEGSTAAQQIAAGIMPTQTAARDEKANTKISRLIIDGVAGLFGSGKRKPQLRGGMVPKGFNATAADKARFAITDHEAPQVANYLTSLALVGVDPAKLSPNQHWDYLRKGMRGQAGYLRDMVLEYGLRNQDMTVATDDDGTPMTLGWLMDPLVQLGDRWQEVLDKAHAYGVAQRSGELEERFTRQVEDEIQAFAQSKVDSAANSYQKQRAEEEVAAFAKEKRAALRKRLSRLTAAGGGLHNATETAAKALAEMQADPDRKAIEDYLRRYRLWANWNLNYAVQSELLSPAQAENIQRANQYYIDWHRVFGEDDGPIDVGQAVEGSARTIHNPLASLLHATWSAVSRGDANRAQLAFTAPLRGNPVTGVGGSLAQLGRKLSAEQAQDAFTKQNGYHDDATGERRRVYRVRRLVQQVNADGSPVIDPRSGAPLQEVETENWVYDSGTEASMEAGRTMASDHPWMLIMQGLNSLQRKMITLAPGFRLKVPVRDNIERLLNSEVGSGVGDTAKILRHQVELDGRNLDELFTFSGANMAGWNQQGREQALSEVFDHVEGLRKKGYSVLTPKGLWKVWERFGEETENLARKAEFAAAYRKARADGMDQQNAALVAMTHARGLLDTAERGYVIGRINGIALFLNAHIKGLQRNTKIARAAVAAYRRGDTALGHRLAASVSLRLAAWGGALMAARLLKLAWGDDEEQKEELTEPAWKRDFAMTFDTPGLGKVAIPKPYEWGWLGSGFERMADYTWAKHRGWNDQAKRAYEGYGKSFLGAVMPIEPDMMGGSFMPALEVLGNFDTFTQGRVVPTYEEKLDLDLRKGQERASGLGKALGAIVRADARNVDHLIRGYFGGFGGMATSRTWGELAKRASGYSGETSIYGSRDVSWVLDTADSRGLSGQKEYRDFRKLLSKASGAEGEERDRLEKAARARAVSLRAGLERKAAAAGK